MRSRGTGFVAASGADGEAGVGARAGRSAAAGGGAGPRRSGFTVPACSGALVIFPGSNVSAVQPPISPIARAAEPPSIMRSMGHLLGWRAHCRRRSLWSAPRNHHLTAAVGTQSDIEYIVALAGRRLEHWRRQVVTSFFQRRSAFASHCCDLHTWHLWQARKGFCSFACS